MKNHKSQFGVESGPFLPNIEGWGLVFNQHLNITMSDALKVSTSDYEMSFFFSFKKAELSTSYFE